MDACQFYGGENDGLMTGHLHTDAAHPAVQSGDRWYNMALQWAKTGIFFLSPGFTLPTQSETPHFFITFEEFSFSLFGGKENPEGVCHF